MWETAVVLRPSRARGRFSCTPLLEATLRPRQPTHGRLPPPPAEPLRVVNPDAAGLDIPSDQHGVAVPPHRAPEPVRMFGALTCALEGIADWLARGHLATGVMASTGVSWLPLFAWLERRGVQVRRLDPRQAQRASGRPKPDRDDGQWRQHLQAYGLRAGACRPDDQVCVRRSVRRPRQMRLTDAGQPLQPRQTALAQLHVRRAEVVRDSTGKTGMPLLKAILAGQRAPHRLAPCRDRHGPHEAATMAKALQGPWREDHRVARRQARER